MTGHRVDRLPCSALQPRLLLRDELTSALDPELIGEVLEVVRKLTRSTDITTLIVTHETSGFLVAAQRSVHRCRAAMGPAMTDEGLRTDPW